MKKKSTPSKKRTYAPPTSILHMDCDGARAFLLKTESFCTIDLPEYFNFSGIISDVAKVLGTGSYSGYSNKAHDHENINYRLLGNKDGKYSWRPFEILNPVIYVSLVNLLTKESNWKFLRTRFSEFGQHPKVECHSLPLKSEGKQRDKATQIKRWWSKIEQESIALALDFDFLFHADIANCYSSIYTHSISWALHTKAEAKSKKSDETLLGNQIDSHLRAMSYGQTNGIPQGSVLMDFIAEMVLGAIDLQLSDTIKKLGINSFKILRYRDDYRVFVNSTGDGMSILKALTEVLAQFGMKINSSKTYHSGHVVRDSLKEDKYQTLFSEPLSGNTQKQLLKIYSIGEKFPDSGSLVRMMQEFFRSISKRNLKRENLNVLLSITVEIMYSNPKTIPVGAAILSKLLSGSHSASQLNWIEKIKTKFSKIPNTGLLQVWLQRISFHVDKTLQYPEGLCSAVSGETKTILWNVDWLTSVKLKKILSSDHFIDRSRIKKMSSEITFKEVDFFAY